MDGLGTAVSWKARIAIKGEVKETRERRLIYVTGAKVRLTGKQLLVY